MTEWALFSIKEMGECILWPLEGLWFYPAKDTGKETGLSVRYKGVGGSVLKFTYELSTEKGIPFLDVRVNGEVGSLPTSVSRKPTDDGKCLNVISDCPDCYKVSVKRKP